MVKAVGRECLTPAGLSSKGKTVVRNSAIKNIIMGKAEIESREERKADYSPLPLSWYIEDGPSDHCGWGRDRPEGGGWVS